MNRKEHIGELARWHAQDSSQFLSGSLDGGSQWVRTIRKVEVQNHPPRTWRDQNYRSQEKTGSQGSCLEVLPSLESSALWGWEQVEEVVPELGSHPWLTAGGTSVQHGAAY